MRFSTKGRYGLRAIVDLAAHSKNGHVALGSVAERQGISINYLEQVFAVLRKSGMVKSVKGAQGGYSLAEDPADIKVGAILRILEGQLSMTDDVPVNTPVARCLKENVWDKMNLCLNEFADSITVGDLVKDYLDRNGEIEPMYYI